MEFSLCIPRVSTSKIFFPATSFSSELDDHILEVQSKERALRIYALYARDKKKPLEAYLLPLQSADLNFGQQDEMVFEFNLEQKVRETYVREQEFIRYLTMGARRAEEGYIMDL